MEFTVDFKVGQLGLGLGLVYQIHYLAVAPI